MEEKIKQFPYGEGHMHIFMNGVDYKRAVLLQQRGEKECVVRENFSQYQKRGITWVRDGGDCYGTSRWAKDVAGEYGITYRTPVFAIHKEGHYGAIVGRSFADWRDYHRLIGQVREEGGDFIKLMISGIMDFDHGGLCEAPLDAAEIRECIHIAHEEGFPVMVHANGSEPVKAAALAGADSIEHGNFCNADTLQAMASSGTIWVPTIVTVKNLLKDGRFPESVLASIWEGQKERLALAWELGVSMALGSDAGAYRVLHGQGLMEEYETFQEILSPLASDWETRIARADARLKNIF